MKIGIIAHDDFSIVEPFQGGLEKFTCLLVRELVHRGHEVVTLCNSGSELPGTMVLYTEWGGNWKDDAETLELSKFEQFYSSINNFMNTDFNIIHNHTINHHAIVLGSVINIPFITSFHCPCLLIFTLL